MNLILFSEQVLPKSTFLSMAICKNLNMGVKYNWTEDFILNIVAGQQNVQNRESH